MAGAPTKRLLWFVSYMARHREGVRRKELDVAFANSGLAGNLTYLPRQNFERLKIAALDVFNIEIKNDKSTGRWRIVYDEDLRDSRFLTWLIDSFSILGLANKNPNMQKYLIFEPISEGKVHLDVMTQSIQERKTVRFGCGAYSNGEELSYELMPYCLRLYNRRWYVIGKLADHSYPELLTHADRIARQDNKPYLKLMLGDNSRLWVIPLDEITEPSLTDNSYEIPPDFSPDDMSVDVIGSNPYHTNFDSVGKAIPKLNELFGAKPQEILVKARFGASDSLMHAPLHQSQVIVDESSGAGVVDAYRIFRYNLHPTPEFYGELLRFGPAVEVLWPKTVRKMMQEIIEKMLLSYKKS